MSSILFNLQKKPEEQDVSFPAVFDFLFRPMRYKVALGGRGSSKSWSYARALLIIGASKKIRVLCTREVQKSIKDSVKRLLDDQIGALGLSGHYQSFETEIRAKNGTEFSFSGLSNQTATSIKSMEGYDIVWCEEAQTISKKSWDILIPTIRKDNSEIWVTFNPSLDTDDTYLRFVTNPPPNCISKVVNYNDNKWFPDVLESERLHCLETNPKDYPNIWEGKCKPAVDGAIYADEMGNAIANGQICNVPYDPMLKVHAIFDLGFNDDMAILLVQRGVADLRIIEAINDSRKTLDYYSTLLKQKNYDWGEVWLPHDGKAKDYKSGKSSEDIMLELGWSVSIVPSMSIEEGIRMFRQVFSKCYFDKSKTANLIDSLKRYRRNINSRTEEADKPLHDSASHYADACRYMAIVADMLRNNDIITLDRTKTKTSWRI